MARTNGELGNDTTVSQVDSGALEVQSRIRHACQCSISQVPTAESTDQAPRALLYKDLKTTSHAWRRLVPTRVSHSDMPETPLANPSATHHDHL